MDPNFLSTLIAILFAGNLYFIKKVVDKVDEMDAKVDYMDVCLAVVISHMGIAVPKWERPNIKGAKE